MKKYLVIFDLDGTLIQSDIEYAQIKSELQELLKSMLNEETYLEFTSIPRSILEIVSYIAKVDRTGEMNRKAWEIVEKYELKGYEKAVMYEDVIPTLKILKKNNHRIAILTNNSTKLTKLSLKNFHLEEFVELVVTRDDVRKTKPDPEGIKKIMTHFNKSRQETIFIGDSWLDAEAAIRAGIRFAYFGSSSKINETRDKKIEIEDEINSIHEILSLL